MPRKAQNHQRTFRATVIPGTAQGRTIGFPTINLTLSDVPDTLEEGVYAAMIDTEDASYPGALFFGKRSALNAGIACEVHLLKNVPDPVPPRLTVRIIERIRDTQRFTSVRKLREQIAADVQSAHAMLAFYDRASS